MMVIESSIAVELLEDLLLKKRELGLHVLSGSMMPLVKKGDEVIFKHAEPNDIKIGDIIVFKKEDRLIVHRVIRKYYDGDSILFLQKGDNSTNAEVISGESIIGKVFAIRKGGKNIRLDRRIWGTINKFLTFSSLLVYYFDKPFIGTLLRFFHRKAIVFINRWMENTINRQ